MAKSANMINNLNLPPILPAQFTAPSKQRYQNNLLLTDSSKTFNVNKCLFKLNEQIFELNKFKIQNLDNNLNVYVTISNLLNNLNLLEKHQKLDLINWNIFRGLIDLFVDIIKLCSSNFKYLTTSSLFLDNLANFYSKKTFDSLSNEPKHIIICCNTLKILYILLLNSRELKFKLEDLNGLDELIKLINNDSFVNNNDKHKCLESTLLMIYNLSMDYKKKLPLEYGHILLKFNKVDDVTAFLRCKSVLNFFPNNESFEERIGTKVTLFLKLLKKTYASTIKAEINSIFFIYSALKEVKYKSKLVKLILDENCLQIFLIKLSELSFLCNKFVYPPNNKHLDQKLIPCFDSNQNMNNSYRMIYYSYVFYQLLYLDGDYYKKLSSKTKYYITKFLSSFLINKEFLKNFSTKFPSTIIDLEKCLLCLHTLNQSTFNDFDINVFEILFNIGNNYVTCAKESVLILSKLKLPNKLIKVLERFFSYLNDESNEIEKVASSNKIYNCLFLLYILLEEKLNKDGNYESLDEEFEKLILNDKYQKILNEIIKITIKNLNTKINEMNLENYSSSKEKRQNYIMYYFIYLNWFTLSYKLNIKDSNYNHTKFNVNIILDTLISMLSNHINLNYKFQLKITQSLLIIFQMNSKLNNSILIDDHKFESLNNILYDLITDTQHVNSSINTNTNTYNSSRMGTSTSSRQNKEFLTRCQIIDDIVTILVKIIENDSTQNYLNFYLKLTETQLIDLKFKSFKPDNLVKIFHIYEHEYFNAYAKYKQTSTYNLLILSEYFRINIPKKNNFELTYKFLFNLKQLFLYDEIYLIEKKYIIDTIISLILNDHCQINIIKSDAFFIGKLNSHLDISQLILTQSIGINLKDEMSSRYRERSKISMRKLLSQTCQELNWLISDDFQLNKNLEKEPLTKISTIERNVLIMYAIECINDCFKIRDELEKNGYRVNIDSYDDSCNMDDTDLKKKYNLDRIKKLIYDNSIIVVCLTDKYKKTKYGNLKVKYANVKQKIIIPIKMTRNFELNDWMINLNRDENKINFINMDIFDHFTEFLNKILSTIKNQNVKRLSIKNHSTSTLLPTHNQSHFHSFRNISISSLTNSVQNPNNTIELSLKNFDTENDTII